VVRIRKKRQLTWRSSLPASDQCANPLCAESLTVSANDGAGCGGRRPARAHGPVGVGDVAGGGGEPGVTFVEFDDEALAAFEAVLRL